MKITKAEKALRVALPLVVTNTIVYTGCFVAIIYYMVHHQIDLSWIYLVAALINVVAIELLSIIIEAAKEVIVESNIRCRSYLCRRAVEWLEE